jgi:lysophospholipase L1-like esterase
MAALGDSITAAVASCLAPTSCPRNSWATGTGTQVDSHYERILRFNPAIRGNAHNYSVPGATAADLAGQASRAAEANVEYIAILIGANDACRDRIDHMTAPKVFRSQLDVALDTLTGRLPNARILMLSVPDITRVWESGHTNKAVLKIWSASGSACPSLLANPTSTDSADTARRRAFADRLDAYNKEISAACAAHGSHCRYDRGATHRQRFDVKMLSPLDFFHPNASGQRMLARVTYPGRFSW